MVEFTTPVGRLVYGHPLQLVQKKDNKKQPVFKDGKPVMHRNFGVAYDKASFGQFIWPVMQAEAQRVMGGNIPDHFSWKFKDGDTRDRTGKPYSQREGYAGCCVVNFSTEFDIAAFRPNPNGTWDQIGEKDFKTGDYIAVNANFVGNKPLDPLHTPGLYTNPNGVLHIGNGNAIMNTPSADAMFSGHQFALPPGATAPGAPPTMPAGMPNAPGMGYQQQPAPQYGAPPPQQQAPAYGAAPPPQYGAPPPQQHPTTNYGQAPAFQQQPAPQYGAPPPQQQYAPAPDFVQNAMGQPPQQQAPAYGAPPPQYGAPAPGGYQQQPMPGTMPAGFPPR